MSDCGKCYPCWLRLDGSTHPDAKEPCKRPRLKDSHVRVWKRGGYWTIEMFTGDELVTAYVGEPNAQDAFERAASWLCAQEQRTTTKE